MLCPAITHNQLPKATEPVSQFRRRRIIKTLFDSIQPSPSEMPFFSSRRRRKAAEEEQAQRRHENLMAVQRESLRLEEIAARQRLRPLVAKSVASSETPPPPPLFFPNKTNKPSTPKSNTYRALEQSDGSMVSHVWKDKNLNVYIMRKCIQLQNGKWLANIEAATDNVRQAWLQQ